MKKIPDWLVLNMWRSLLGEIYPSIRAIALHLDENKRLLIRYYLDRNPRDFDRESVEVVASNLAAAVNLDLISKIDVECICNTQDVFSKLEYFDGFIYCRREYDLL